MKSVLFDTNILVEIVRGSPRARVALERAGLRDAKARGLIPAVCAGELLAIQERNSWGGAKREALKRLFKDIPLAPIARPEVWTAYALIQCWTQGVAVSSPGQAPPPKQSRPMGQNDLWIAAIAHTTGASLLTGDRDFLPLDGIWFEVIHVAF